MEKKIKTKNKKTRKQRYLKYPANQSLFILLHRTCVLHKKWIRGKQLKIIPNQNYKETKKHFRSIKKSSNALILLAGQTRIGDNKQSFPVITSSWILAFPFLFNYSSIGRLAS